VDGIALARLQDPGFDDRDVADLAERAGGVGECGRIAALTRDLVHYYILPAERVVLEAIPLSYPRHACIPEVAPLPGNFDLEYDVKRDAMVEGPSSLLTELIMDLGVEHIKIVA
jgi:hypothetical protein